MYVYTFNCVKIQHQYVLSLVILVFHYYLKLVYFNLHILYSYILLSDICVLLLFLNYVK